MSTDHHRPRRSPRRTRLLTRTLAIVALGAVAVLTACEPAPAPTKTGTYVAIGDSGTAGPAIPDIALPIGCAKSTRNFPNLASGRLPVAKLIDASCSGATMDSVASGQSLQTGEWYPSQLDRLDASTKIVTVTIGFNDVGASELAVDCMKQAISFTSCEDAGLSARLDAAIVGLRPKLIAFYREIKRRAPNATVFSMGSPEAIPSSGDGCFPQLPIIPRDLGWIRAQLDKMSSVYRDANAAAGVIPVELPNRGAGHDVCQSPEVRWVEPPIPGSLAAPLHTNAAGHRALADALVAAVARHVPA